MRGRGVVAVATAGVALCVVLVPVSHAEVSPDSIADTFPVPLFSGRIAALPGPGGADPRRSGVGRALSALDLERHVVFLTPEQFVDPEVFCAEAFPVALYLAGEFYVQTVREPQDGDAALLRYLDAGGRLLVLPDGPFPFYYNEAGGQVGTASKFGMNIGAGAFSAPPEGHALEFHPDPECGFGGGLPDPFPFPRAEEADQRWRPITGAVGDNTRYVPLITLRDETGRAYGEGAAAIEFPSGARVLYVWSSLMARADARRCLLVGTLRYMLDGLAPPRRRLSCLRVPQAPSMDGALDESIWRLAPGTGVFQTPGEDLRESSRRTLVRACWDSQFLYVAFDCAGAAADPARDSVQVTLARPDPSIPPWELTLAADGTLTMLPEESGSNTAPLRSGVQRREGAWTAEVAVPFAAFRDPEAGLPRLGDVVAGQFVRRVEEDVSVWSSTDDPVRVERFGAMVLAAHPWSDDFDAYPESADGSESWTPLGGIWRIEGGTLIGQDGGTDGTELRGAFRGDDAWRDYALSVRFKTESRGSDGRDGPWFGVRCHPDGDGYVVQFGATEWSLHKVVFGVATRPDAPMARGTWTPDDSWRDLRIEVRANRILGALDGVALFDVKDDAHLGIPSRRRGGIMLSPRRGSRSDGATVVRYDDVVVEMLEE